jgi:hypothetical protein
VGNFWNESSKILSNDQRIEQLIRATRLSITNYQINHLPNQFGVTVGLVCLASFASRLAQIQHLPYRFHPLNP